MRIILISVCLLHAALAYPAENVTEVVANATDADANSGVDKVVKVVATATPVDVKEGTRVDDNVFTVHSKYDDVVKPMTTYPKKTAKPFPNFPAMSDGDVFDGGVGKQNFMLKLFFGRDPIDFDIVEEQEQLRPPTYQHHGGDDGDMKEIQMFPPNFPKSHPSKFDMFPYESVAKPYDSSKNVNSQKQQYANREFSFRPFFNYDEQEQTGMREADRYESLLDQKTRFGLDPDMRYVYHPYFGYIPTNEVSEDIMREVVPGHLFRMHPRHGFVPALDDSPSNDFYDSGYDDRFGMNHDDDVDEMFYPKRPQIPANGNAFKYGPMPPRRGDKPMMVKVIGKPETEVVETTESESDSLSRSRRDPQILIPQYFYNPVSQPVSLPAFSVYQQHPSMLYQPQYFYNPVVRSNLQPLPVTKPLYTLTDAMRAKQGGNDVEVSGAGVSDEEGDEINLPVDPPGAHVANDPLPETSFPIFPYDPEQDEPAAVAF